MDNDILAQRRRWFRFFPEGSLEFLVATRVLVMILLLALLIVGKVEVQLMATLIALTGVLWLDYILIVWWAVQIAIDLKALQERPTTSAEALGSHRLRTGILSCLPSVVAAVIIAPWAKLLHFILPGLLPGGAFIAIVHVVLLVLFILLVVIAQRTLQRIQFGPPLWTVLFMVPVVHLFAIHRLMAGLERRLRESTCADASAETRDRAEGSGRLAVVIADVTWVLAIVPWFILIVLMLLGGAWPAEFPQAAVPFCGVPLTAIFAVANLAAMEQVQRQFIAALRKR